ncbi:hypothetical protein Tco_1089951 [Tanacetum coccineum]|uniref:Uncharacterized protein n=1 Tax=Tanacetum coccineum TaxID=301880 RepID=A0ABQ5I4W0_9ASTR
MVKGKPINTEHKLNEYSHIKPIRQKRRSLGPDRSTAACKEVEELMKARILQMVKNETWVANSVMVKKSDEGWMIGHMNLESIISIRKIERMRASEGKI